MLAAASSEEKRVLELVHLALQLVRRKGPVPPQLSQHVDAILRQAVVLAQKPDSVQGKIFPEAIQLALQLREIEGLRNAVENAPDLSSMTPEQADEILSSLELQD
jgi:hypothetical protein